MKIVIDDKIPFIRGVLESYAEVFYLPGGSIDSAEVLDAEALVVRTRTACNRSLLEGSKVKFIATATIGIDHIDAIYCKENGVSWTNAPGCNAASVQQYVAVALIQLAERHSFRLKGKTLGIVGVGHVGKKVKEIAELLGLTVLLNDPPRARIEGVEGFVPLEKLLADSDIVSFHLPLNYSGVDKTAHLADEVLFSKMKKGSYLINTSRGEVIQTKALKQVLLQGRLAGAVIDVWENEPTIDLELLNLVDIATPHIAGYSQDGKANGTAMSIQALSRFFDLPLTDWFPKQIPELNNSMIEIDCYKMDAQLILSKAIVATYDIMSDDKRLRTDTLSFEKQRGDYPIRRGFGAYKVQLTNFDEEILKLLTVAGFTDV